ncbi:MAG: sulfatase-like hydrolase/transferase [bacterium]
MKEKLLSLLQHYSILLIAFLPLPLLFRIYELNSLTSLYQLPPRTWGLELAGLGNDYLLFFTCSLILLFPYLAIGMWKKTIAAAFFSVLMLLVFILSFSAIKYFTITLIPLDQVIFSYSWDEIISIVISSTRVDIGGMVVYVLIIAIPLILLRIFRKRKAGRATLILTGILLILSPVLVAVTTPSRHNYLKEFDYYLVENKLHYAGKKVFQFYLENAGNSGLSNAAVFRTTRLSDPRILEIAREYQKNNQRFIYLDPAYPFLRMDNTYDALGRFFNLNEQKPNLVFFIVESLTPTFCGTNPYFGSFMPFLDSLISKSLYWNNFLATSERTFNVFPAVFASLPYSKGVFIESGKEAPIHFSMIRYLKDNGYYPSFFYGGDPKFTNYEGFLVDEGVEFVLKTFGKEHENDVIYDDWFRWGYPDGELFERSLEILDSLQKSPRLDIYLTLSMHAPFIPPNKDQYLARLKKILDRMPPEDRRKGMIEKLSHIFSTILYTDDMLRRFFDKYRQRPGFGNTIFLITGDHAMPELHTSWVTPAEKYHVPLIIYSPMLNQAASFDAVSSHLDITPSFLALLRPAYGIHTNPYCHWLGSGIDVSSTSGNKHALSFVLNNKEEVDYLRNNYFLSYSKLYVKEEGFSFKETENSAMLAELKKEHENYLTLSRHIADCNALVPLGKYIGNDSKQHPIPLSSVYRYHDFPTNAEFIGISKPVDFDQDFKYIYLEMNLNVKADPQDAATLPKLVVEIVDSTYAQHLYLSFDLNRTNIPDGSGESWDTIRMRELFDVSRVEGLSSKFMKLYLWNKQKIPVKMDTLSVKISGFTAH